MIQLPDEQSHSMILGADGKPMPTLPKREAYILEFFAYETIGIPVLLAIETGQVVPIGDDRYLHPEGSSIGPAPTPSPTPPGGPTTSTG